MGKRVMVGLLVVFMSFTFSGCGKGEGVKSTSIQAMPDVKGGGDGVGFTCTGLTYDKNEGVFYIGNIGKETPKTDGFKSTIVKVSKDFKTNLGEINIYDIYPDMLDVQGLTIDNKYNSFWFCSFSENKIRHISKEGKDLGFINYEKPTGLVYDNRTDSLWVLSYTKLVNIKKDGTILKTIAIEEEGQDQIWLDEVNNIMYITAGNNYKGSNFVFTVNLESEEITKAYTMADSFAVEGIHIENNIMYILNDGYYHKGKVKVNQVNIYDLDLVE